MVVASPSTFISVVPPDSLLDDFLESLFSLPALHPSSIVAVIATQRSTDTTFFFIDFPPFRYIFLYRVYVP